MAEYFLGRKPDFGKDFHHLKYPGFPFCPFERDALRPYASPGFLRKAATAWMFEEWYCLGKA